MKATFFLALALALMGHSLVAQQTQNPEELIPISDEEAVEADARVEPLVSTWDFVRMVLVLGAVVGVIYLLFFLLKRGSGSSAPQSDLIRLLDYRSLSGSRGLYLVEVGTAIYLVGASDSGVSLVSEIDGKESLDSIRLAVAERAPRAPRRNFAATLGSLFGEGKPTGATGGDLAFIKKQRERLRRLR